MTEITQADSARFEELEAERDALAAAMPVEQSDMAIHYAVMGRERDEALAKLARVEKLPEKWRGENSWYVHDGYDPLNRTGDMADELTEALEGESSTPSGACPDCGGADNNNPDCNLCFGSGIVASH